MIKYLQINFSQISFFSVVAAVSAIIGLRFVGNLADNYGPKPLFFICGIGGALIPFLWIFTSPDNYSIIWFINIISGACWAGIGLASGNILMNLAPVKFNAVYFSVFAALTGIFSALAPILGGFLGVLFTNVNINLVIFKIEHLQVLFLLSTVMRLLSLLLLTRVNITQNISITEMLSKLKNWHRFFPAVNRHFSLTSHTGNYYRFINRGMVDIEKRLERIRYKKNSKKTKK